MIEIEGKRFEKVDSFGGTQLFPVAEYVNTDNIDTQGLFCAKFRGSLLKLFGQPTFDNKDLDEGVYQYIIKCTDKPTGAIRYFNLVEFRLGPALSASDDSSDSKQIGQILWDRILSTDPADFKTIYFDDENTLKVYYGCQNSSPYFNLASFNILDYVIRFSRMLFST